MQAPEAVEGFRNSDSSYETSPVLTSVGAASRRDIRLGSRLEAALTRKKFHFRSNWSATGVKYGCSGQDNTTAPF